MRIALALILVIAAAWLVALLFLLFEGRRIQARRLISLVPNLAKLMRGILGDPRVPRSAKWVLGAALIWLASPIDLIPEFIPVIGALDDVIVAALALRHLVRRSGPDVLSDHWNGDDATLELILRAAGIRA